MKKIYNSKNYKHLQRKKLRLERSFSKGTNKPKKKNQGEKGFQKYFWLTYGNTATKKGIKKKYRGKVYR